MRLVRPCWMIACSTLALCLAAGGARAQTTKLLPDDTELVVTINLQQMLKSEVAKANKTLLDFAKQAVEQKLDENPASKYLKKANFSLLTDLHAITLAMPAGRDFGEGMIVVTGKFDAEKIEAAATEASKDAGDSGFKVIQIAGAKAFQLTTKDEQKTIYIGVLNAKTLIGCTSKKDFATAVERLSSSQQARFKPEFKNALKALSPGSSVSIAATSAALTKLSEKAPESAGDKIQKAAEGLKKIDGFAASLTIQKDIEFQIAVNTKDAKTATELATASNLGLGLAKNKVAEQAKNDEKFAAALTIINSIRASATGSSLNIRGQITFATLEKIIQLLPLPGN